MTFKDYLISRRIDPSAFAKNEPRRYREFGLLYDQVHIKSFVMQKLFILNSLRTQYPHEGPADTKTNTSKISQPKTKLAKPVGSKPRVGQPGLKISSQKEATTGESRLKKPKPVIANPKVSVKPKMARPVVKPTPETTQESSEEQTPKKQKPVIKAKPKIPKKPSTDTEEIKESAKPEAKARPKIQPRPIIKKK